MYRRWKEVTCWLIWNCNRLPAFIFCLVAFFPSENLSTTTHLHLSFHPWLYPSFLSSDRCMVVPVSRSSITYRHNASSVLHSVFCPLQPSLYKRALIHTDSTKACCQVPPTPKTPPTPTLQTGEPSRIPLSIRSMKYLTKTLHYLLGIIHWECLCTTIYIYTQYSLLDKCSIFVILTVFCKLDLK